ncbi:MAG: hypothetical protein ACI4OL_08790 [Gemmiger sp.]
MKKLIGVILVAVMVTMFMVCNTSVLADSAPNVTATPVSSTSRQTRSVPVTETYAKTDVVDDTASSETAVPAELPADTPATGDFPLVYVAGAVGLILICSAGLVMLRRI